MKTLPLIKNLANASNLNPGEHAMKTQNLLKSILGMALVAVLLPIMSCDNDKSSALVGQWVFYESKSAGNLLSEYSTALENIIGNSVFGSLMNMELFMDGTGVDGTGHKFSWKVQNKRFIKSIGKGEAIVSDYKILGSKLIFINDDGSSNIYIRKEEYDKMIKAEAAEREEAENKAIEEKRALIKKGSFTDARDNNTYKTVILGEQTWLAENMNYETEGSACYDNDPANCAKYGRLYNWETAMIACPSGWHLPSVDEWDALSRYADGTSDTDSLYMSETAGKYLKATNGWKNDGNGEDSYGFSALPGGFGYSYGSFDNVEESGFWWSVSENDSYNAYRRRMNYKDKGARWDYDGKSYLFSVRCLQGDPVGKAKEMLKKMVEEKAAAKAEAAELALLQSSFTDSRDGKRYKTIKIGAQAWMAENLDYAGKNDDIGKCYGKEPENCKKYGALYNWDEAMKVCPTGWHLPSKEEWQTLVDFAGGDKIAGKKLRAKSSWNEHKCKYTTKETTGRGEVIVTEHDECATDEFGFSALPGGSDGLLNGSFDGAGRSGHWWSASEGDDSGKAYSQSMMKDKKKNSIYAEGGNRSKSRLFSVRCLQD